MLTPPPRPAHLRVFVVGLVLLVVGLAVGLFAVRVEAVASATGAIVARDRTEVRVRRAGLIEPGWHEGEFRHPTRGAVRVRLDGAGDGSADPADGPPVRVVRRIVLDAEDDRPVRPLGFHRLQVGDEVWAGQPLATLRPDETSAWYPDRRPASAEGTSEPRRLPEPVEWTVPASAERWLVLEVPPALGQAVQAGDVVAILAPLDSETRQLCGLVVRLDIDERHFGDVRTGQRVRVASNMYNPRLHGSAEAVVERLEPAGEALPDGSRRFHAWAAFTHVPFTLRPGSSVKAEIVLDRRPTYRVIVER